MLALQNDFLHRSQLLNVHRVSVRLPARAGERCLWSWQGRLGLQERKKKTAVSKFHFPSFPKHCVAGQGRLTQMPSQAASTQTFPWRQHQLLLVEAASLDAAPQAVNSQWIALPHLAEGSQKCLNVFGAPALVLSMPCSCIWHLVQPLPFYISQNEEHFLLPWPRHRTGITFE